MYFVKSITIALLTVWPERLDPPPLGKIGIEYSFEICTNALTSFTVLGTATQSGTIL